MIHNCAACEKSIERRKTEQHHFPTPKRLGGTLTVPLCRTCHTMIDRINLEDWPLDWWFAAWAEMPMEARLLIFKIMSRFPSERIEFRDVEKVAIA